MTFDPTCNVPPGCRVETDLLGMALVPEASLFGLQTQRAIANFPISGRSIAELPLLIRSLAQVKKAAALTNLANDEIERTVAEAIIVACDLVIDGQHLEAFTVDILQGGAGTSTNMNMNEVLANLALISLGHLPGDYSVVHPNDHVNRNQSTNDVYATAARLSVYEGNLRLIQSIEALADKFEKKASSFKDIRKLGRTQLQDAVPMTVEQEFQAFASTLREDAARARETGLFFLEVNLGGTAVGSGVGASEAYSANVVEVLKSVTGRNVVRAKDLFEASWDMGAFVFYSGLLKRLAAKLSKICNDLRLLGSGPCGGLSEIGLPPMQPGSSIMPGKINPVIPEVVNQVAFKIFGLDLTITFAAEAGQLQLNAFAPIIVSSTTEAIMLLCSAMDVLGTRCVDDIVLIESRCKVHLETSLASATDLVPIIGYKSATEVAALALKKHCSVEAAYRLWGER